MSDRPLQTRDIALTRNRLPGTLRLPARPLGLVIFAHGGGSSRLSPRNVAVAEALGADGMATLLFDLLTDEEAEDRRNVFDIALLSRRLADAVRWAESDPTLADLPVGLFGASTGAAAALVAAADFGRAIRAVVSRGGRPDLAGEALARVTAPSLLIVGGADIEVLALNRAALRRLPPTSALEVIPGATHLFQEPGALAAVARLASGWFQHHLPPGTPAGRGADEANRGRGAD